ncbi:2-hydroxychromene-2-carboxylate isomerase family protein, glutathione-dependent [Altererythrobacter epoxidivorans]|uniref:2-hydroxychromene-2-carboxylate isomerase n=1 Tax=Altererythrobacter epoxidivorans TaxID=361183 RepID=A0A0M5L721_9SPHN|nr:2-hydroxychromene-2-carboxylate isomerase [Altererythrobacter epoxidivorans]ALE16869.1 2-hydroxychromene-2-carboxylate isomerase family protein, glutathione-dependent [Altererythrobacter epoxidivorans]
MTARAQLLFDFVSPNAYLIWWPMRDIIRRTGAELDVLPVFLGGMHKLTGNAPPMIRDREVKGKNEYAMLELERFVRKHELSDFKMNPNFPFNSILLQRMLFAADQDGRGVQFVETLLPKIWEQGLDVTDPEAVGAAVAAGGFDVEDLFRRAQTDEVKEGLFANTENAVERGAFGIPTVFIGDEMFFGKERLEQIEAELDRVG